MTTAEGKRIAHDNALVVIPADLGITATGSELEKLFFRFLARHGKTEWKLELRPMGELIFTPPRPRLHGLHAAAVVAALEEWNADVGGHVTGVETS